ncbi:acetolactate synthase-1/2/3 large subunit [Actinoplanes lutulentus]|uniref:Acetolactate synthase large subunit n=1 Tax=Actinoplanes lutulentus TaxID=1287878 RepID=A0A327YYA8_9ACTN|nr:5-guanidino-2-oxopentanoate decarboxylase [Actinoplanes lutulentus]MBB2946572.1 acetolactate synthase-1/2/3 large subunit [Actinoplanes lutulentus]RAK26490.1 acetolactate synthase large subunit [Actinoplanes lutulentus]
MRAGHALALLLREYGVESVFGIPGVHTIELYRGFAEAGISTHPARHEQGAGFMADAYARQTGKPGVCALVTGPGVLNALTPLAQAWHDSIPLLFVTATTRSDLLGRERGPLHDIRDQVAAVAGVTEHSWLARTPQELPGLVARAWTAMTEGRPRPAHIAIPIDVLTTEVDGPFTRVVLQPEEHEPDQEAFRAAAALLGRAGTPAIIAGGGARGAAAEVRALAEMLGAPVVTTGNAAGLLPPGHPLAVGTLLPFAGTQDLLRDADVVLAVGTEFSETDVLYTGRDVEFGGSLIRLDIDPANLQAPMPAKVALQGDAGTALARLTGLIDREPAANGPARAGDARAGVAWTAQSLGHHPWLDAVSAALPEDTAVVLDSTQLAYTAHHYLSPAEPTAWTATYGLGTLGAALPMAVGAAIAQPQRPVLAIAGDGGSLFTLTELATAVDLGRQLTLLIWDNRGYGEIRDSFDRASATRVDTEVTAFDHALIAQGFGAHGVRVTSPEALGEALHTAMRTDVVTVVVAAGF